MSTKLQRIALVAAAGLCAPAFAQDSVSNVGTGLPGDAENPYDATTQCRDYVADLVAFETSKGNTFGIVPIIKSPRSDTNFFNNLLSAQAISPDLLTDVDNAASNDYRVWDMAGFGVNPTNNTAAGTITGPANSSQFAVGFSHFGGSYNGVVGAVVNVDSDKPSRLYVQRRTAAGNGTIPTDNLAQIGFGAVDANGNIYYRADNFGTGAGSFPNVSGNNLFRTRMLDRDCGLLSTLSGNPASFDATDGLVVGSGTTVVAPNMGPASIFGGNGIVATGDFNADFVYGPGPVLTSGAALGGTDTRGTLGFSSHDILGNGGSASYAQLNKDAVGATVLVNVWEVNGTGAPTSNQTFLPPAAITDNQTGVTITAPGFELDHYHDQQGFRGGSGQIAMNNDPYNDNTSLIAVVRDFVEPGINIPLNEVIVCRYNHATGAEQWTQAGYIDPLDTTNGKPICDANGMAIGRMEELFDVTGGSPVGPSMSSPAIDAAGNVWFVASVGFFDAPVPVGQSNTGNVVDFDSALLRAVYNPTNFSYSLEKVVALGDVFKGANSDTEWQVTFTSIADGNSISSSSFFSSNASEVAFGGLNPATLMPSDPRTTAGVVLNAQITYDVDGDGDFEDPSGGGTGTDEEYQVLLYIGYPGDGGIFCDCNGDGTINIDDIDCFVAGFLGGDLGTADCNGDGVINIDDIDCFVACFLANV